jgi:hypothetical protein
MLSHYFTHATEVLVTSVRDAVGLVYSAIVQLLEGDIFNLQYVVRMLLKLVLASFLLVTPAIADIRYLTSNNVTRSYWLHLPDDFQEGYKYPVVIAFHGGSRLGSDADGFAMELDTRLSLPLVRTSHAKNVSYLTRLFFFFFHLRIIAWTNGTEIFCLSQWRWRCMGWANLRRSFGERRPAICQRHD